MVLDLLAKNVRTCLKRRGAYYPPLFFLEFPTRRGSAEVPNPGVAAFIGFAAQAQFGRFESAAASALHTLPFSFDSGDPTGTLGVGI